jgi:hypothetical protein
MDRKARVLRELADAARPYGFAVEAAPDSLLPDLVFYRPGDRVELLRLRYFEASGEPPFMPPAATQNPPPVATSKSPTS